MGKDDCPAFNANGMTIMYITNRTRPELVVEVGEIMKRDDLFIVGCTIFFDTAQEIFKAIVCYYPE